MSAVGAAGSDGSTELLIVDKIINAEDLRREKDFIEVDGVRRVSEIRFTSALVDAELGQTAVFTRSFTYDGGPNFDLAVVEDELTVT